MSEQMSNQIDDLSFNSRHSCQSELISQKSHRFRKFQQFLPEQQIKNQHLIGEEGQNGQKLYSSNNNKSNRTLVESGYKRIRKQKIKNQRNNTNQKKFKRKKKRNASHGSRIRKSQNLNKIFNTVALNTLKQLDLGQLAEQNKRYIYRHDYFLFILMIARGNNRFEEFAEKYHEKIQNKLSKVKQKYKKKNEIGDLRQMIKKSISSLNLFKAGNQEEARQVLFDQKLRNVKFLQKSKKMVEDIYRSRINQNNQESCS